MVILEKNKDYFSCSNHQFDPIGALTGNKPYIKCQGKHFGQVFAD